MNSNSDEEIPEFEVAEWLEGRSEAIHKFEPTAIYLALEKGFKPIEPYKGTNNPWKLECMECGEVTKTSYFMLKFRTVKCKNCLRIEKGIEASKVMFENYLEPLIAYSGNSADKWESKCVKCGKIVYPRFYDIQRGKGGCKDCGSRSHITPEYLEKIMAVMKEAQLEPLDPFTTVSAKWRSRCLRCGEEVFPTFHNVNRGHGGCIYCQEHAFKHDKPAYFYIIEHVELGALKVGVGNVQSTPDRLKTHIKDGWTVHQRIDFEVGRDAFSLETHILRWFRKELDLPPFLEQSQMKKAGRTETISSDGVTVPQIKAKVEEVLKELKLPAKK